MIGLNKPRHALAPNRLISSSLSSYYNRPEQAELLRWGSRAMMPQLFKDTFQRTKTAPVRVSAPTLEREMGGNGDNGRAFGLASTGCCGVGGGAGAGLQFRWPARELPVVAVGEEKLWLALALPLPRLLGCCCCCCWSSWNEECIQAIWMMSCSRQCWFSGDSWLGSFWYSY